jgi:hypothetical protein
MRNICFVIITGLALRIVPASAVNQGCWEIVPAKNAPDGPSSFYAVSVISPNDVWAAGNNGQLSVQDPLLEHWDGQQWTIVPTPPVRVALALAQGISGVSANDVWMVGGTTTNDIPLKTVAEHWDGAHWNLVSSPNPPEAVHGSVLRSVTTIASDDVWAVGYARLSERYQTLIEHWDGAQWTIIDSPVPASLNNLLHAVKARAPNDVWAVGWAPVGEGAPAVAFHWDGTQWSNIPVPAISPCYNLLTGVAPVSANDVWAVGWYTLNDCVTFRPLILRWNGTQWNVVPSPILDYDNYALYGVKAFAADDVWAVGEANGAPLAMHWDGSNWSLVTAEKPPAANKDFFWAIDGVSSNAMWAVGVNTTLAERFTTPCDLPTPTPTPLPTPTPTPIQSVACDPPGITVLNDGAGDAMDGQPEHEIQKVSVAEPSFIGPAKIMFVIKTAGMVNLPPNTTWSLIFKAPNGSDYFVRMKTNASGNITGSTASYASGPGTDSSSFTNITRADEAMSSYSADGTIRIVVRRGDIGSPAIGEQLTQFSSQVRVDNPAQPASPFIMDTAPSDLTRTAAYTLVGNERCPLTENACTDPGITVLSDPDGDPSDKQPGHDALKLSVAEPLDSGPNKMVFTLKVKSLATVPPDTRWPIRFVAPNGIDYTVRMTNSPADGATTGPIFQVGTTAQTFSATGSPLPAADPASSFNADGTIRIVVPTSAIGHPNPGETLSEFSMRIAANLGGNTYTPDNVPDDILLPTGATYTVGGNASCRSVPTSVVSRKIHGSVGTFDVDLPLDGGGIECRSGGANGNHTLVFTFPNGLTSVGGAAVSSGTGTVSNSAIGSDPHNYIVDLSGVANAQTITVKLASVVDGVHSGDVSVSMRVLSGDTNADGFVNSSDIAETKSQSGNSLTGSNFREDVTADGNLNSADIALVKSKSGTASP